MASNAWRKAGAEFLVIFAGVSLGLLADDWRQDRADAEDGQEILRLIQEDLVADSVELASLRGPFVSHRVAVAWLQRAWPEPTVDVDTLRFHLSRFAIARTPQLRSSAFSSLRSGGRLGLIQDPEIRTLVVKYYEESQVRLSQYFSSHTSLQEALLDELSPHILLMQGREEGQVFPFRSESLQVTTAWGELRDENEVHNRATSLGVVAHFTVLFIDAAMTENQKLRGLIAQASSP